MKANRARPAELGAGLLMRVCFIAVVATAATLCVARAGLGWGWAALGGVVTGGVLIWWALRPLTDIVTAAADGLLSFRERDYSLRIVADRDDALGELAARFNALGEMLRSERNDAYQKEMLLEMVLEQAPTAIVLTDEAETIVIANGAARELLHGGRSLLGMKLKAVLEGLPSMCDVIAGGDDVLFTVPRAGGEPDTYHFARRYFELSTQRHVMYLLKPLTRELRRQEVEVWKKAIRVMSHEIANSLAPISSLLHSARTLVAQGHSAQLDKVFDTLSDRTQHLATFLDGYAQFARLPRPEKQEVAWTAFFEPLRPLYPFRIPEALPAEPGWFDPGQLQQVLINLLKNAVESGSPHEDIVVTVSRLPEGAFAIEVLDRGSGMSEEIMAKALLPFFSTKKGGSGLGLPLCREIVDAHGGRLATERREDGGTRVRILLPGR